MTRARVTAAVVVCVVVLGAAAAVAALMLHGHDANTAQNRAGCVATAVGGASCAPATGPARTPSTAAGGSRRQRLTWQQVADGFARGYAAFLDGGPSAAMRRFGSITSASQATQAGRIPAQFRDGSLQIVARGHVSRSCCSAEESVVFGDRQEHYPFTVELLYEGNEWLVNQIEPVDLSVDDGTRPDFQTHVSSTLRAATVAFARSYVAYRDGASKRLPQPATTAALGAIREGSDTLADTTLPSGQTAVAGVKFGPPSGGEVAATVTVHDGQQPETFSLLMTDTGGRWRAAAFL